MGSWQLNHLEPEILGGADDLHKLRELYGFGDVAIGMELVTSEYIFVRAGGGEHDDGNHLEADIRFYFSQDLTSIFAG